MTEVFWLAIGAALAVILPGAWRLVMWGRAERELCDEQRYRDEQRGRIGTDGGGAYRGGDVGKVNVLRLVPGVDTAASVICPRCWRRYTTSSGAR